MNRERLQTRLLRIAVLVSGRWFHARQGHKDELVQIEGEKRFAGLQKVFETVQRLTSEKRLSIFEEVVAEFAPFAKRGKLCNETDSESGRNHYVHTTYENVSLYSVIHNRGQENATASMVQIRWDKVSCPNPK